MSLDGPGSPHRFLKAPKNGIEACRISASLGDVNLRKEKPRQSEESKRLLELLCCPLAHRILGQIRIEVREPWELRGRRNQLMAEINSRALALRKGQRKALGMQNPNDRKAVSSAAKCCLPICRAEGFCCVGA